METFHLQLVNNIHSHLQALKPLFLKHVKKGGGVHRSCLASFTRLVGPEAPHGDDCHSLIAPVPKPNMLSNCSHRARKRNMEYQQTGQQVQNMRQSHTPSRKAAPAHAWCCRNNKPEQEK